MKSDLSDLNMVGDSEPRWDKLLESMGQRQHKPFVAAPQMASVHGRDMFLVSWDRIIAAFSVVFETTEDKKVRSPPFLQNLQPCPFRPAQYRALPLCPF